LRKHGRVLHPHTPMMDLLFSALSPTPRKGGRKAALPLR
jgi:hypothetical protein